MSENLKVVPISSIRGNPNALRTVNRTTEKYQGLVDSIRKVGVMNPILVRECKDPQTGELFYGLTDGLHRFTGSQDAGKTEIPVHIQPMSDIDAMQAQLMANIHKIETKPFEYSKHLMRIMALDPLLTPAKLAGDLGMSVSWIKDRLGLSNLVEQVGAVVDEEKIVLMNAYALSKLPQEEQANFVSQAMTMQPQQFLPLVNARAKELRDAKRQGRDPNAETVFQPAAKLRKLSELKAEFESNEVARILSQDAGSTFEAFRLGIAWALHLDPRSAQAQRDADNAHKQELKDAAERRKQERQAKKDKEAADKAAALQAELVAA